MNEELIAQAVDHLSRIATALEELQDTLLTRPAAAAAPSGGASKGDGRKPLPVAACVKTDDGRYQYEIPEDAPEAKCRKCGEAMWWVQTRQGWNKPLGPEGFDHRDGCDATEDADSQEEQTKVPF